MGKEVGLSWGCPARWAGLGQQCGVDSRDADEGVRVHRNCLEPGAVMCTVISLSITVYHLESLHSGDQGRRLSLPAHPEQHSETLAYIARPWFMNPYSYPLLSLLPLYSHPTLLIHPPDQASDLVCPTGFSVFVLGLHFLF